ncbi:endonuclease NucS domain-containing protein [Microbacterium sp. NPDC096154]|uniref:endonuclease NucS domain-containing protein n=1 Tax=Microbacterium sp. NPDC096154 TaxID=3155549 RepID=UPI00331E9AD8
MTASENDVRDQLATRLSLIEPGLQHVANNYHVRNAHGADGFVDILARDSTGSFVVIELKKAISTSRQAMHEVGKYVDLLGRDKGLPPEMIRAIVVSTDWHELLVPFSYYVHHSDFDLRGFQLDLEADGLTPKAAQRVTALAASTPRSLTAAQRRIDGDLVDDLSASWDAVKDRLRELQIDDFVALHLSLDGAHIVVLALGTVLSDDPRDPMSDVLRKELDFDDEDLDEMTTEELVLLGMECEGHPLNVCYPEKVGSLVHSHGWQVDLVERSGVFEDADLFPEADLLQACEGWTGGLSAHHFNGRARTSNATQWAGFRGSISKVIADSPGWVAPARLWLDQLEVTAPQWDISANVYDNHDFLQALLHGYRDDKWIELVPHFSLAVEALDGDSYGLWGYLRWDGTVVRLVDGLRAAYENIGEWGDLRAFDDQHEANIRLLEAWHLSHELTEKRARRPLPEILLERHGALVKQAVDKDDNRSDMMLSWAIVDFLEAHADQLDELVAYLKNHVTIDPATATQMHFFDGSVDSDWY